MRHLDGRGMVVDFTLPFSSGWARDSDLLKQVDVPAVNRIERASVQHTSPSQSSFGLMLGARLEDGGSEGAPHER